LPARATGVASPSLRILLVEDDVDTADALFDALRGMDYQVSTASTMQEALAAGQREKFDLLLCDIGLPDGSGVDVMRWFGKKQAIPGIALSGYAAPADLKRSHDAGFAMHLIKPITTGALRAAIQEIDGASGQRVCAWSRSLSPAVTLSNLQR
jgi:two-component system CheB/CheR fusion protein